MRVRTSARLGGTAIAVLGMLATFTPTASANGVGAIVFVGTAKVQPGLCLPAFPTCPSGTKPAGISLPPNKTTNSWFQVGGTTANGSLIPTTCTGEALEVDKIGKEPFIAGLCTINGAFTVTGYCGLSSAQGVGTLTLTNSIDGSTWAVNFRFMWIDPGGGNLLVFGNYFKNFGLEGDFLAYIKATPAAANPPVPCVTAPATLFDIQGAAMLIHPKLLPF